VSDDHDSLAGYLSEYLGACAENEDVEPMTALNRPMNKQAFRPVTWVTNTRRFDFSNGAQDIIARDGRRRDRAEDRGGLTSTPEQDDGPMWTVRRLCEVSDGTPNYYSPTAGGVQTGPIDGRSGINPPNTRVEVMSFRSIPKRVLERSLQSQSDHIFYDVADLE
jgi:hypothetical protein